MTAINAQTTIVDVTNPTTGATWMDRNLGATQAATSSTDVAAYGDLYQWGRSADGHELRTSLTTTTIGISDTPGHADFIINGSSPNDWHTPQNDNLWQGTSGINNPCPNGYRLPTSLELNAERASWASQDNDGAFSSTLKFTAGGVRLGYNGNISSVSTGGYYWSSTAFGNGVEYLAYASNYAGIYNNGGERANALCIRCIKDATNGINDESKIEFSVYPNPATNNVTIESNNTINSIQIVDLTGAVVQTETQSSFSIEQLTNGVYLMNIITDNGTVTKRLIKE